MSGDDIIIGKTALIKKSDFPDGNPNDQVDKLVSKTRRDSSTSLKHSESGKIDQVAITVNELG